MRVKLGIVARESRETLQGSKRGLPVVGLEHLTPGELTLTEWSVDNVNTFTKTFRKGQMLFGRRRAYLKKAAIAPFDGICSGDITVIESDPNRLLPELLPFVIQNDTFFDYAIGKSAGSLSPRVKWEHLCRFKFELPPIAEQQRLADLLWAANATREAYKKLLAATDEIVKSRFVEMFGSLDKPKREVEIKSIESVCEKITDGTHQTPIYSDSGYMFLSSKDVKNGYIDLGDVRFISQKLHDELSKRVSPQRNDILLAKNGTTGIAALVETDEIFDIYVSLALLRPKSNINPIYLLSAINNDMTKQQFDAGLKGIGVPNLHLGVIKEVKILIATINAQNRFAEFVRQADKSKFELQRAISALEATYKAILRKNLG
jgi:type I restriction enzyme S subunit